MVAPEATAEPAATVATAASAAWADSSGTRVAPVRAAPVVKAAAEALAASAVRAAPGLLREIREARVVSVPLVQMVNPVSQADANCIAAQSCKGCRPSRSCGIGVGDLDVRRQVAHPRRDERDDYRGAGRLQLRTHSDEGSVGSHLE